MYSYSPMTKPSLSSAIAIAITLSTSVPALAQFNIQVSTSSSAPARATSSAPAREGASSSDPQAAKTDVFLEIKGVDGESKEKGGTEDINIGVGELQESARPGVEPDEIDSKATDEPSRTPGVEPDEIDYDEEQKAADYFMKFDTIEGESKDTKSSAAKGNVPGVEPDEIDVAIDEDPQPVMPDFGILLGGDTDDDDEEALTPMEELILNGLKEEGAPAETLSLNYEKIKTKVKDDVKLFGLFAMDLTVEVEVNQEGEATVDYPWWSFLVSGKEGDTLGEAIAQVLSNVFKTKHDIMLNAVRNMK